MNEMDKIKEIKLTKLIDTKELINLLTSKDINLNEDLLTNEILSESLKKQLILRHLPEIIESPKAVTDLFYSKYFWLATFNNKYKNIFGEDVGLDQQLYKLCEEAEQSNLDIDWNFVEKIEHEAMLS
jgi:hypothetical protein